MDLNNEQVTIKTEQGIYQGSENLSLSSNSPDNLYVIDGKIIAAMTITENEGYSVSVLTNKSVAEVKADYEDKLKNKN